MLADRRATGRAFRFRVSVRVDDLDRPDRKRRQRPHRCTSGPRAASRDPERDGRADLIAARRTARSFTPHTSSRVREIRHREPRQMDREPSRSRDRPRCTERELPRRAPRKLAVRPAGRRAEIATLRHGRATRGTYLHIRSTPHTESPSSHRASSPTFATHVERAARRPDRRGDVYGSRKATSESRRSRARGGRPRPAVDQRARVRPHRGDERRTRRPCTVPRHTPGT